MPDEPADVRKIPVGVARGSEQQAGISLAGIDYRDAAVACLKERPALPERMSQCLARLTD